MTLAANTSDLALRVATEAKALRTLLNGNAPTNAALQTANKANLVAAINELQSSIVSGGGAAIDDTTPSASKVYSSSKTDSQIQTAVAALVSSAPGVLDTLKELADALGGDPNFASTITSLIGTKANDDAVVKLNGAQTIGGVKTFTDPPVVPNNSFAIAKTIGLQPALDGKAATNHSHTASQLPKASTTEEGIVQYATSSEVVSGASTVRVVSPANLKVATADFVTKAAVGDTEADFVAVFESGLS